MGRAMRTRKRKKSRINSSGTTAINYEETFIELIEWMKEYGWKPACKLVSAYFRNTGRGLMAKERICSGTTIVKIPYQLLITVKTVAKSEIRCLFPISRKFMTQQVLATFLVWESHLGNESDWKKYINCLPKSFPCPVYCNSVSWLPMYLREKVEEMKNTANRTFENVIESVGQKKCTHCGTPLKSVFKYEKYIWAWCVVNTRAVYLCPNFNKQNAISLSDENNLALAPYIDFFNHNFNSEVKAYVVESEGVYLIETLKSVGKNDEVFINYGPLSNDRLFINYGFINPLNEQDSISFTYEEILSAVNILIPLNRHINEYRRRFLQSKNMFSNVSCHATGLSWDCQALIYVFICAADVKIEEIKQNVFSNKFKQYSKEEMNRVTDLVVETKCIEFRNELTHLINVHAEAKIKYPECYAVTQELLHEHINLLEKCRISLAEKIID